MAEENPDPHCCETLNLEEEEEENHETLTAVADPEFTINEGEGEDEDEAVDFTQQSSHARRSVTGGGYAGKKKKKKKKQKQKRGSAFSEKKITQKLDLLVQTVNPVPFVPNKGLDFSSHEELLTRLGLWDFVHLEFDSSIRSDLLLQLIASYNHVNRSSHVNGSRIMVNRADLARALKLPLKKDKGGATLPENVPVVVVETEESISFVEELVSNWMLLHDEIWLMPADMMNWMKFIKKGEFDKVDWAQLMWFMLEKELLAAPQLVNCYYASHMQCLIKHQKATLLDAAIGYEENGNGDLKMGDDTRGQEMEEKDIDLTLGQDNISKSECHDVKDEHDDDYVRAMDFDMIKTEEADPWIMQPCNTREAYYVDENLEGYEHGDGEKEQLYVEEHDTGYQLSPRRGDLDIATDEALRSDHFSHHHDVDVDVDDDQYEDYEDGESARTLEEEFLASKVSLHMSPGCSMPFGGNNGSKRAIDHMYDMYDNSLNVSNSKRMRTDGAWNANCDDFGSSDDFGSCMGQAQEWFGKATGLYLRKKQDCEQLILNRQALVNELDNKDHEIEQLSRALTEEQHKRQVDVYKFEKELYMMMSALEGYRKSLKESQKAFSEYRDRCPLPVEPLYQDAGPGGLVLSKWEVENLKRKQEEEERLTRQVIDKNFKEFEDAFVAKFRLSEERIAFLGNILSETEKKLTLAKEDFAKHKVSAMAECFTDKGVSDE